MVRKSLSLLVLTIPLLSAGGQITYSKDVAPILYQHCTGCHHANDIAPMSLMTYKESRPWAASLKEAVVSRAMPPWHADPHYGKFSNDMRLQEKEIAVIKAWAETGAREGNPADLPPQPKYSADWHIGKPDAVFDIGQDYALPSGGPDEYNYFTVPTNFKEDKWVKIVELRPGNRRVVHHAHVWVELPKKTEAAAATPAPAAATASAAKPVVAKASLTFNDGKLTHIQPSAPVVDDGCKVDDGGYWPGKTPTEDASGPLGSFLPGKAPDAYPAGTAKLIPAGAMLRFQVHYSKTTGKPETDRTQVGFIFSDPPEHPLKRMDISNYLFLIPPGDGNHEVRECHTFERDMLLLSYVTHMHFRGKDMRFDIERPDGSRETLLNVPHYNFNWQQLYKLAEPVPVTKGDRLIITAHFDNSVNNRFNPDPTKTIRWGEPSQEEMMDGWFEYIDAPPGAVTKTSSASARK